MRKMKMSSCLLPSGLTPRSCGDIGCVSVRTRYFLVMMPIQILARMIYPVALTIDVYSITTRSRGQP